jgi:hypothetical protein
MCFDRAWKIGLKARAKALMLSHHTTGVEARETCNSCNNILSQYTSVVTKAKHRYSASVLDFDTTGYFLANQDMRLGPTKTP